MKKSLFLIFNFLLVLVLITGCSSKKEVPDLNGTWKQTNSNATDSYQEATISGTTIEINWITDNGATKSLYWVGTFEAPTTTDEPYTWTSKGDVAKMENAILASQSETKDFKYEAGVLSYEASMLGTTTTIKLEKTK